MDRTHSRIYPLAAFFTTLIALVLATASFTAVDTCVAASDSGSAPIVNIGGGAVRGVAVPGGYVFSGLPYAAPPLGDLRWRPPEPPAEWNGVRDATELAPGCPQIPGSFSTGPTDEDCLYLNVFTPELGRGRGEDEDRRGDESHGGRRPVLVWIHGGGWTIGKAVACG